MYSYGAPMHCPVGDEKCQGSREGGPMKGVSRPAHVQLCWLSWNVDGRETLMRGAEVTWEFTSATAAISRPNCVLPRRFSAPFPDSVPERPSSSSSSSSSSPLAFALSHPLLRSYLDLSNSPSTAVPVQDLRTGRHPRAAQLP